MKEIGSYTLDTLQIYFPWDDDLYTYFKERGFGTMNHKKKALPLIYTDNTISTVGQDSLIRNYVLNPEYYGNTYEELGWTQTSEGVSRPIIPAEKPNAQILLIKNNGTTKVRFKIIPNVQNREQYHIEYSSRASFGKMYANWSMLYFNLNDAIDIANRMTEELNFSQNNDFDVIREEKQEQREELDYTEVPIIAYNFSLGGFKHAADYLENNGFDGTIPSLTYDSTNPFHNDLMKPLLKYGIVYTKDEHGFMERNPQFVLKISQPFTINENGRKKRVKGYIEENNAYENWIDIDACDFLNAYECLKTWYNSQPFAIEYPLE